MTPTGISGPDMADHDHADAGVRVLCADDHQVLIEGLRAQFSIDRRVQIVGSVPSTEHLVEEVERLRPDVVLLDIEMPGPDVFEVADRLHHQHPRLRLVFLSAHVRDGYIAAAYKCGASGYFAKGDDLRDIVAGVLEVARRTSGTFIMGPKVKARCVPPPPAHHHHPRVPKLDDGVPASAASTLSPREVEVLRLIGKGRSRSEIATELCRSAKTVDGHQERMMKKLGIDSRSELIRYAIREGFAEA